MFGLKQFLSAGYTKKIDLIPSAYDKNERIFTGFTFSLV